MLQYLKNIFQVIISPDKGWEDVAAANRKADKELMPCFLLLNAVAAVTVFLSLLYGVRDETVAHVIVAAVVVFAKYIVGYFIAVFIFFNFLSKYFTGGVNENKIRTFCIYSLSILVIFQIITNLIPHTLPIMSCLPLYLIVVVWKSMRYLLVNDSQTLEFVILASLALIAPQYIIGLFANLI